MLEMILKAITDSQKSNLKSNLKSNQKVLLLIQENENITIKELCEALSMSESGIKKVIKKLKNEEKLDRVGSLKTGHWVIL